MGPYSGVTIIYVVEKHIEGIDMILGSPWQKENRVHRLCRSPYQDGPDKPRDTLTEHKRTYTQRSG
jgi:hypothetical protein